MITRKAYAAARVSKTSSNLRVRKTPRRRGNPNPKENKPTNRKDGNKTNAFPEGSNAPKGGNGAGTSHQNQPYGTTKVPSIIQKQDNKRTTGHETYKYDQAHRHQKESPLRETTQRGTMQRKLRVNLQREVQQQKAPRIKPWSQITDTLREG